MNLKGLIQNPYSGLLIIVLMLLISLPIQIRIDDIRGKYGHIEKDPNFDSSALKFISIGYDEIFADIYWLRTLQYFGSDEQSIPEKSPELLCTYFDIITDLDPGFINAYRYGGTLLAEPMPIGLGDFEKGTELMDKGRKNNPDNFRIPLEEAFLYYLYSNNFMRAAELFNESSEKPGLSDFRRASIKGMSATASRKGGDRELSKKIWEYIYENTENEGRKKFAIQNLNELETKDMEDELTNKVGKFEIDNKRLPEDLNELVTKGYLEIVPKDHKGLDFIIVDEYKSVRSKTLVEYELKENRTLLNRYLKQFKLIHGYVPADLHELKRFIENKGAKFPIHPLGYNYIYSPKSGRVNFDESFLQD